MSGFPLTIAGARDMPVIAYTKLLPSTTCEKKFIVLGVKTVCPLSDRRMAPLTPILMGRNWRLMSKLLIIVWEELSTTILATATTQQFAWTGVISTLWEFAPMPVAPFEESTVLLWFTPK